MPVKIDLNNMAGGALAEKLGIEFQKVADNIADPNTKAKAKRKITLEITFAPTEDRDVVIGEINAKSKLESAQGTPVKFIVGMDGTTAQIAELKSGSKDQMMIDLDGDLADDLGRKMAGADNVTPIDSKKTAVYR